MELDGWAKQNLSKRQMAICTLCRNARPLRQFAESPIDCLGQCKDCMSPEVRQEDRVEESRKILKMQSKYNRTEEKKRQEEVERIQRSPKYLQKEAIKNRNSVVKRFAKYSLTIQDYEDLLRDQGGVCAICSTPPAKALGLVVDHDHATSLVRGLLCAKCNTGLGQLGDTVESLQRALVYLEKDISYRNNQA